MRLQDFAKAVKILRSHDKFTRSKVLEVPFTTLRSDQSASRRKFLVHQCLPHFSVNQSQQFTVRESHRLPMKQILPVLKKSLSFSFCTLSELRKAVKGGNKLPRHLYTHQKICFNLSNVFTWTKPITLHTVVVF